MVLNRFNNIHYEFLIMLKKKKFQHKQLLF